VVYDSWICVILDPERKIQYPEVVNRLFFEQKS
jgi:hypothetical protein